MGTKCLVFKTNFHTDCNHNCPFIPYLTSCFPTRLQSSADDSQDPSVVPGSSAFQLYAFEYEALYLFELWWILVRYSRYFPSHSILYFWHLMHFVFRRCRRKAAVYGPVGTTEAPFTSVHTLWATHQLGRCYEGRSGYVPEDLRRC